MRLSALALVLLVMPLPAVAAQHDSAQNDWSRVQRVPPGKTVTLKVSGHKSRCHIISVDAESITCASADAKNPLTVQRTQVTLVQTDHRTKSALIGLGTGALGGVIFGASVGKNGGLFSRGDDAAIFLLPGAILGLIIGTAGNFAHTTLYKAP